MCVSLSAFPEAEYRNPMFFFHDVDHAVPVGNCVYQKRIYLNNSDPLLEIILSFLVGKADIPNLYIVPSIPPFKTTFIIRYLLFFSSILTVSQKVRKRIFLS
jgi:hypothetical protein